MSVIFGSLFAIFLLLVLQDYHGLLIKCIKDNLGFKDGKPVAACIIYKCLLHWHAFEAERTTIFDYIIEGINSVLKVFALIFFIHTFITLKSNAVGSSFLITHCLVFFSYVIYGFNFHVFSCHFYN